MNKNNLNKINVRDNLTFHNITKTSFFGLKTDQISLIPSSVVTQFNLILQENSLNEQ